MHKALLLTSLLFLAACGGADDTPDPTGTSSPPPEPGLEDARTSMTLGDPLSDSGLRFDGVYQVVLGERIVYLVRFFPEGHVVLVAGPQDTRDQLAAKLVANRLRRFVGSSLRELLLVGSPSPFPSASWGRWPSSRVWRCGGTAISSPCSSCPASA